MKRWAFLTIILYAICATVLGIPIYFMLGTDGIKTAQFFYSYLLPILIVIQCVLLFIPVAIVQKRPIGRRSVVTSAIFGAIPMTFLALMFLTSLLLMIWGEDKADRYIYYWPSLVTFAGFWVLWGILFYKSYSESEPGKFTAIITRWLVKGSILELLVAIPSHIISRRREECCAPPLTFLGIITGLAIALLSFGPGLFFLFQKRIKDKRPDPSPEPTNSVNIR
ncbi:MAG TPA: hypothetical protein PKK31_00785 [Elusimicrobiales bacterium]|nr:hypothetical protein [Elusimicrobiales bacterium]